ncbi:MAG: type I-MYXAN CRISPR-associated protein Cas6/Cmx6 [Gammaproteobacteria bacterium]|nr:MAG: type I-MYXAN CRISPR-associated protein Cas6/Cmx6 [Gammaproteobacteria bacterium]
MYWEESQSQRDALPGDDVVDIAFAIQCRMLPVDHAYALSEALCRQLPWLPGETGAGVHHIYIPETGNGWSRGTELMHLSHRTKLIIRVPGHRIDEAQQLTGTVLNVSGHEMTIKNGAIRRLSELSTLVSRFMVYQKGDNEALFQDNMASQLKHMGIRLRKMLPGRTNIIATPDGEVYTRSVMLAELDIDESIKLQQLGLGQHRRMGCGMFVPQRDIKELNDTEN